MLYVENINVFNYDINHSYTWVTCVFFKVYMHKDYETIKYNRIKTGKHIGSFPDSLTNGGRDFD